MYCIRYILHLKLQGIICISAAIAWNYLRFSLVFSEKEFYISNIVHWRLLKLFIFYDTVYFLNMLYTFLLSFLYINLYILM